MPSSLKTTLSTTLVVLGLGALAGCTSAVGGDDGAIDAVAAGGIEAVGGVLDSSGLPGDAIAPDGATHRHRTGTPEEAARPLTAPIPRPWGYGGEEQVDGS